MAYFEKLLNGIEFIHRKTAAWLVRFFTFVWRKQAKVPLWLRFSIGYLLIGGLAAMMAWQLKVRYLVSSGLGDNESFVRYLEKAGHLAYGTRLAYVAAFVAALALVSAAVSWLRKKAVFRLFEGTWALFAVVGILYVDWTFGCGAIVNAADHKAFDLASRDELWAHIVVALSFAVWPALVMLVALLTTRAREYYRLAASPYTKDFGGKTIVSLKTGGNDPRYRSSLDWALFAFWCILILPFLLIWFGWEKPYALPKGGGEMSVQQQVVVKKVKKKKKPKKITVNPFSPYILERMNIDDVKTLEELEEATQDTYVATQNKRAGGKGKGTGGWPQGLENSAIRFIRLKYRGGDWDQDMGKGADYNLLIKFHEWTGMKIARETEFREIERLKYFPHKLSPPFVFMTGMRGINLSDKEVKVLRDYCLVEGGMLFIDNGGGHFDGAVKAMLRRVFPGKPLVDIPNDDSIYQCPYVFPDGAPPFWHHAGYRASGIRDEGRWVVFYHPGDVNDAWKDDHSGASAEVADQAYKLGVNIMFYAFNQYYRRWYEQD